MARYVASVETSWERQTAFEYLAAFSNISDWDPGVARAKALSDEHLEVGSRFEVVTAVRGRETTLVYETIEIDAPRRVRLRAESGALVSVDEMTFLVRPGGGTIVTYDADLRVTGLLRIFGPLLGIPLRRLGDAARDGLRKRLAGTEPS
jgi:polyketide cyclase/dehydrase/lipid transport protein